MTLPQFALDLEHRAAIVFGRRASLGPVSTETVRAAAAAAAAVAEQTGLPLALVAGVYPEDGAEKLYGGAAAGIVLAHAAQEEPAPLSVDALRAPHTVPAALWEALEAAGIPFPEEDAGLFLVPAGWSVATLASVELPDDPDELEELLEDLEDDDVVETVAAEDTDPVTALTDRLDALEEPLCLIADYC